MTADSRALVMAILDEPPFCWRAADGTATGCDVEVATAVARALGRAALEFRSVTFAELMPGLAQRRWDFTTALFVTDERARSVRFTRPLWAARDGFIVRVADADRLVSYAAVAADPAARLGVVFEQVQIDSARQSGVPEAQLCRFDAQHEAVAALLAGTVDAVASTAIGNRALVRRMGEQRIVAVDLVPAAGSAAGVPVGAFALRHDDVDLAAAVDAALGAILGSPDHRAMIARYGLTDADLVIS